ncbi:MAG: Gfo/Idh/MocA family oxidoreductase [Verrucomicrobia bacterium]|nr:Gfo/Idh/MocA family oxidoreductase [Verrucomicrobiota bacterium]
MATNKLKGVCIGAGYFSHFQYEAWQRIPEVEIVAFSNRDQTKAAEITRKFGLHKCYPDYREMFDKEEPDFVDIITPPPSHQAICAEAAQRCIHIICQKALAPTFDEAKAIVADATAANVRFMVHENFRFQPWHREIKRQLQAGAIGELHSLAFRSRMGDGWGENAYIPRQPYFREYPRLLVFENGVHFVDTYRFLAGEISRVTSWHRRLNPVIKGEDCALVVFDFANGALGEWDANRYNETTARNPRYTFGAFLVEGTAGSIRLATDSRLTLQPLGQKELEIHYERADVNFCGDCVYFTQRHFVDRMLDGKAFETSGEEYLKTLTVQEAVYQSAETRSPVEVKPI